jgi:hypothetical protein
MRVLRVITAFLLAAVPLALWAGVDPADLPGTSKWYFHADLAEMRATKAGQHLYGWLEKEVFEEVRSETGVDLGKETDRVTAFAGSDESIIVVVDGPISQESKDKLVALGAASGSMDQRGKGGGAYYHVKTDEAAGDGENAGENAGASFADHYDAEPFEKGAYFSFAVPNKIIVTSTEADMKAMLANKGRAATGKAASGTLLVLSADKSLIQAGLNTDDFADEIGWDSNIIRNTEQLALLIADEDGLVSIQAQLLAAEKEMAESLGSIVRGLISLASFSDEVDPEISQVLKTTEVAVDGGRLTLKLKLDPEVVVAALDD